MLTLSLITIGLTILAITGILAILFFIMYHTYHGNLPGLMKLIIAIFFIIATVFIILNYVI